MGCSPWGREELDMTERLHFHFSLSCIGEGNGNPLQCSCLENPRDRGAWWAAVYGVAQSRTQLKQLSSSSRKCGIDRGGEEIPEKGHEQIHSFVQQMFIELPQFRHFSTHRRCSNENWPHGAYVRIEVRKRVFTFPLCVTAG